MPHQFGLPRPPSGSVGARRTLTPMLLALRVIAITTHIARSFQDKITVALGIKCGSTDTPHTTLVRG
jgi:hypothetical protein